MTASRLASGFALAATLGFAAWAAPAQAVIIGGVDFPQGAISFADAVVDYSPGVVASGPTAPYQGAFNALGIPDFTGATGCGSQEACTFVSLGDGGTLDLRFTDNLLTGSGTSSDDLWVFEVGPDVEDTFVWISMNGTDWLSVGSVGGATSGVDIDAFGFGPGDQFGWVRLVDNGDLDGQTGVTVGADIDAVGAITTVIVEPPPTNGVPVPGSLALLGLGSLVVAARGGRARR